MPPLFSKGARRLSLTGRGSPTLKDDERDPDWLWPRMFASAPFELEVESRADCSTKEVGESAGAGLSRPELGLTLRPEVARTVPEHVPERKASHVNQFHSHSMGCLDVGMRVGYLTYLANSLVNSAMGWRLQAGPYWNSKTADTQTSWYWSIAVVSCSKEKEGLHSQAM